MAQGRERRAAVTDTLRGQQGSRSQQQSVSKAVSGFGGVNLPRAPQDTFANRIAAQVGQFADGQLLKMQKREQERSLVEGQLASAQGKSFAEVQAGGDRWALEGYRITQAEAMGASMQQAALDEIRKGAYEQSPEEYRGVISDRIQGMLDGIDDDRMRENLKANLASNAEGLMQAHAKAHVKYKEEQAFDTIKHTIGTLAKSGNSDVLAAMFDGTAPESAVLGKPNMHKAIAAGIVEGLRDDDWAAYNAAQKAGFLTEDNLTYGQMDAIQDARRASGKRITAARERKAREIAEDTLKALKKGEVNPDDALASILEHVSLDADAGSNEAFMRASEEIRQNFALAEAGEISAAEMANRNAIVRKQAGLGEQTSKQRFGDIEKVMNAREDAVNEIAKAAEKRMVLQEAQDNGTVGELDKRDQDDWREAAQANSVKAAQNAVASGDLNPALEQGAASELYISETAKQGVIDPQIKSEAKLFSNPDSWVDASGFANRKAINVVAKMMTLKDTNPELLDEYVRSEKDRGRMNGILARLDGEGLGSVLGQYDLNDPESPATALIAEAIQDTKSSITQGGKSRDDREEAVEIAKDMIDRGNPNGSWFGGLGTNSVSKKLLGIDTFGSVGLSNKNYEARQEREFTTRGFDFDAIDDQFKDRVVEQVQFMGSFGHDGDPDEMARDASAVVQRRGSIIGGAFYVPPPGMRSMHELIFKEPVVPGKTDMSQVNTAITNYVVEQIGWEDKYNPPVFQFHRNSKNQMGVVTSEGRVIRFTPEDVRKAWIGSGNRKPKQGGTFSRWLAKAVQYEADIKPSQFGAEVMNPR